MRCAHLDSKGRQCPAEALDDGSFCFHHDLAQEHRLAKSPSRRPYLYRLAALFLLLTFVFQIYQTVLEWLGR